MQNIEDWYIGKGFDPRFMIGKKNRICSLKKKRRKEKEQSYLTEAQYLVTKKNQDAK